MSTFKPSAMANGGGDFAPCPEDDYQIVVCDFVDLGWKEKTFKGESKGIQPCCQFVYQTDALNDDGKPWLVFGRQLFVSFDERSGFYKECSGILGEKRFKELIATDEFNPEDLIGCNIDGSIIHNEGKNGVMYANLGPMKPWNTKRGPIIEVRDYTRRCLREKWEPPYPSCFESRDVAMDKIDEESGAATAPRPQAQPQAQAPRASRNDPRASNQGTTSKEIAKEMAKGNIPEARHTPQPVPAGGIEDDDDPFADE